MSIIPDVVGIALTVCGVAAVVLILVFLSPRLTRRQCRRGNHDTGWGPWENGAVCIDCGAEAPPRG